MSTIRELITGALRLINVVQANEVPTADDMNVSLYALQTIIDSWSTEALNIYLLKPYYFPLTAGKKNYTLGTGGDWNMPRPTNIHGITVSIGGTLTLVDGAYVLNKNPNILDIPTEKLEVMQYAAIPLKDQQSTYPVKWYDNGDYPLKTISVWPVPQTNNPVTVWMQEPLAQATNLDMTLNFPNGYERALRFALATELAPEFGKVPQNEILEIASQAKSTMKRLNSRTGIMRSDVAIVASTPSIYNYNLSTTLPN